MRWRAAGLALVCLLGLAVGAHAAGWPQFGGGPSRSGEQPVDRGGLPLSFAWGAAEGPVRTSVLVTESGRAVWGTADGAVVVRELDTGALVGIVDVDEGGADADVFGTQAPVGLAEDPSGRVFAIHNDDGAGAAPDIEVAQIDPATGTRIGTDADVVGTDGLEIRSSPLLAHGALFFAANGSLFRMPTAGGAATSVAASVNPQASPALLGGTRIGVGLDSGLTSTLASFSATDLSPGPQSVALGGPVQTPSVAGGFIYVAVDAGAGETVVRKLDSTTLAVAATSAALDGVPAPALAVGAGKVFATTDANLHALSTVDLDGAGTLDLESDRPFSWTTPAVGGDLVFALDSAGNQLVLRASDVKPAAFAPQPATPVAGQHTGQPALSRGLVVFGTAGGVSAYRTADAEPPAVELLAPAADAVLSGSVAFSARGWDTRGLSSVVFRANGQVLASVAVSSSGSDLVAPGADYAATVDTSGLADGSYLIDAVATDRSGVVTVSAQRRVSVDNVPPAPAVVEDRPPAVEFTAPAAGQLVTAGVTLAANATDDRGVASVAFYDDDRLVCSVSSPPYVCPYNPRGEDVGRNTLFAVATDGAGQTASAVRLVRVDRFAPTNLLLTVRPGRDLKAPYRFALRGRLVPPAPVPAALACAEGSVSIAVQRGSRTIQTRTARLRRDCSFAATAVFKDRRLVGRTGEIRIRPRFPGNDVLRSFTGTFRTARAG